MNVLLLARRRLIITAGALIVVMILGFLLLVNTPWGHQVDDDAYFGREVASRTVLLIDDDFLRLVHLGTVAAFVVGLLAFAWFRSRLPVGLVAIAGFVLAVAGAEALKRVLPWSPLVADDASLPHNLLADTYPSGHTTISTSACLAVLLVSGPRWRSWLAVAAGFVSASYATAVLVAGWHRPADALGGLAWSGIWLSLASVVAIRLQGRVQTRDRFAPWTLAFGALVAILMVLVLALGLKQAPSSAPDVDLAFVVASVSLIAGGFGLAGWLGWALRDVGWSPVGRSSGTSSERPS